MLLFSFANNPLQSIILCLTICINIFGNNNCENFTYMYQATVRIGNNLCVQEKSFLELRDQRVKKALESLLKINIDDRNVPRIALCSSGGGFRAMINFLGALQGLEIQQQKRSITTKKIYEFITYYAFYCFNLINQHYQPTTLSESSVPLGLLDICTYVAGTSGSCWGIAGLIQSQLSPQAYLAGLAKTLTQKITQSINVQLLTKDLLVKYAHEQSLSLIDIYGNVIARKIFSPEAQDISLCAHSIIATTGKIPLPIYTAVIGNNGTHEYEWIEFSPFEVGGQSLNAYVPTWAFNRIFKNGISIRPAPPQKLGYCMGICGSVMSANMQEFFDLIVRPEMSDLISNYLNQELIQNHTYSQYILNQPILDHRISPAQVHNWTFLIPQAPLNTTQSLTLIDAGMSCNLPIAPIINRDRDVDIIIILDATSDDLIGNELRKAELYAHKNNLPFPRIDYTKVHQCCSVHGNIKDSALPVVIYMPLVKNPSYANGWDPLTANFTSSYNFVYTQEQIDLLSGLAHKNMVDSLPIIMATIKSRITSS